jgi:hypothetical protein
MPLFFPQYSAAFPLGIPMDCALGDIGEDKSSAKSVLPLHTHPDVCRLIEDACWREKAQGSDIAFVHNN